MYLSLLTIGGTEAPPRARGKVKARLEIFPFYSFPLLTPSPSLPQKLFNSYKDACVEKGEDVNNEDGNGDDSDDVSYIYSEDEDEGEDEEKANAFESRKKQKTHQNQPTKNQPTIEFFTFVTRELRGVHDVKFETSNVSHSFIRNLNQYLIEEAMGNLQRLHRNHREQLEMLEIESTNDIKQDNANLEQFVNKASTLGYDITIRVYYREHASIKFDDFGCGGNRENIVHIFRNVRSGIKGEPVEVLGYYKLKQQG